MSDDKITPRNKDFIEFLRDDIHSQDFLFTKVVDELCDLALEGLKIARLTRDRDALLVAVKNLIEQWDGADRQELQDEFLLTSREVDEIVGARAAIAAAEAE